MDPYELQRQYEKEREYQRQRALHLRPGDFIDPYESRSYQILMNEIANLRRDVYRLSVTGGMQIVNQPYKEEENMSGIVTFLKLDKDQRELNKAGILDDSGILTEEGQEVLLNILIQSKEFKSIILEAAKEYNKGKKKKD